MYVEPVENVSPNTFKLPVMSTSFDALKYVSASNQSVSAPPGDELSINKYGGVPITLLIPEEFWVLLNQLPSIAIDPPSSLSKVKKF